MSQTADQLLVIGRDADGTPAAPWGWEDLDLWLVLNTAARTETEELT